MVASWPKMAQDGPKMAQRGQDGFRTLASVWLRAACCMRFYSKLYSKGYMYIHIRFTVLFYDVFICMVSNAF